MNDIKRGEIYYADLSPAVGSEQSSHRPIIILQNNKGNKHSRTTITAAVTSFLSYAYHFRSGRHEKIDGAA